MSILWFINGDVQYQQTANNLTSIKTRTRVSFFGEWSVKLSGGNYEIYCARLSDVKGVSRKSSNILALTIDVGVLGAPAVIADFANQAHRPWPWKAGVPYLLCCDMYALRNYIVTQITWNASRELDNDLNSKYYVEIATTNGQRSDVERCALNPTVIIPSILNVTYDIKVTCSATAAERTSASQAFLANSAAFSITVSAGPPSPVLFERKTLETKHVMLICVIPDSAFESLATVAWFVDIYEQHVERPHLQMVPEMENKILSISVMFVNLPYKNISVKCERRMAIRGVLKIASNVIIIQGKTLFDDIIMYGIYAGVPVTCVLALFVYILVYICHKSDFDQYFAVSFDGAPPMNTHSMMTSSYEAALRSLLQPMSESAKLNEPLLLDAWQQSHLQSVLASPDQTSATTFASSQESVIMIPLKKTGVS